MINIVMFLAVLASGALAGSARAAHRAKRDRLPEQWFRERLDRLNSAGAAMVTAIGKLDSVNQRTC